MNNPRHTSFRMMYLITSAIWYICLLAALAFPIMLIMAWSGKFSYLNNMDLNFPVATEVMLFSPQNAVSFMDIDSAMASVNLGYLIENHPGTYIIIAILGLITMNFVIYGIYQLRALAQSIYTGQVFTSANVKRMKLMAIVILVLSPLEWLYQITLSAPFSEYMQNHGVDINIGSADFSFILMALLVYIFALAFGQGWHQSSSSSSGS